MAGFFPEWRLPAVPGFRLGWLPFTRSGKSRMKQRVKLNRVAGATISDGSESRYFDQQLSTAKDKVRAPASFHVLRGSL